MPAGQTKARFFKPMLLQRADSLPEGPNWAYEVKLDGYRALAIKTNGRVQLRSRHNKDFNTKYAAGLTRKGGKIDSVRSCDRCLLNATSPSAGLVWNRTGGTWASPATFLSGSRRQACG